MARRLFFAAAAGEAGAVVRGSEARHLARVLRARAGQIYELSLDGRRRTGRVSAVSATAVEFELFAETEAPEGLEAPNAPQSPEAGATAWGREPEARLAAAVIRFERFEWMVEKAVELGATSIQPLIAARTQAHLARAAAGRVERWRRLARCAAQQARRTREAEIFPPLRFSALPAAGAEEAAFFLSEQTGEAPLAAALASARVGKPGAGFALVAGPEGGWTEAERGAAAALGYAPVSLGRHILRAETAVIAALTLCRWGATA